MKKITPISLIIITLAVGLSCSSSSSAQPYGKGIYNEDIPYGNQTSLSIATSGDVSTPTITPTSAGVLGKATSTVTVMSTDVKGYKLYISALADTSMDNLGALLPASANGSPAPLANNTWGYNTDASDNFVGIALTRILIRSVEAPVPSGDITTITYGVKLDMAKPAGKYTASVVYTAVPQTN